MNLSEVYNDDELRPADCRVPTTRARSLADMLQLVERLEVTKPAQPIRLLGDFKPIAMLEKLKNYAEQCNGRAALVCIDREAVSTVFIWNSEADASLSRLTNLKMKGGWVLGYMTWPEIGAVTAYPENGRDGPETECYSLLLNLFARASTPNPQLEAAETMLKVNSLDEFSDWQDKYEDAFIDPISFPPNTETELTGEAI